MDYLISIIIPTYNSATFLKQTIDSVINQTYRNWELLIVDDGSTDDILEIVNPAINKDSRIQYFESAENFGGPAKPRNIGIQHSKGEFIAFLDSDDIWVPNKLELQMECFSKNSDILLVGTNCQTFPNGISNELFLFKNKIISFNYLLNNRKGIITSSVLMKRKVIDLIGYFDEDKRLIAVEDTDFWLRLLKFQDYSVLIMKESLVKYRLHGNNISSSFNVKNNLTYYDKLLVIYHKYENEASNLIQNIQSNLTQLNYELPIKEAFYQRKINIKTLFSTSNISLKSKFKIVIKDFVWTFLRFIRF